MAGRGLPEYHSWQQTNNVSDPAIAVARLSKATDIVPSSQTRLAFRNTGSAVSELLLEGSGSHVITIVDASLATAPSQAAKCLDLIGLASYACG